MQPRPELSQKIKAAEYVYSTGHKSEDAAHDRIDNLLSDCEVSRSERPRVVSYDTDKGRRWAVVLTDTALAAYL